MTALDTTTHKLKTNNQKKQNFTRIFKIYDSFQYNIYILSKFLTSSSTGYALNSNNTDFLPQHRYIVKYTLTNVTQTPKYPIRVFTYYNISILQANNLYTFQFQSLLNLLTNL